MRKTDDQSRPNLVQWKPFFSKPTENSNKSRLKRPALKSNESSIKKTNLKIENKAALKDKP